MRIAQKDQHFPQLMTLTTVVMVTVLVVRVLQSGFLQQVTELKASMRFGVKLFVVGFFYQQLDVPEVYY